MTRKSMVIVKKLIHNFHNPLVLTWLVSHIRPSGQKSCSSGTKRYWWISDLQCMFVLMIGPGIPSSLLYFADWVTKDCDASKRPSSKERHVFVCSDKKSDLNLRIYGRIKSTHRTVLFSIRLFSLWSLKVTSNPLQCVRDLHQMQEGHLI